MLMNPLCLSLRQATRRMTQLYDQALAPLGPASDPALDAARNRPARLRSRSILWPSLARQLDLDRTTMGKNLRPLERMSYVKVTPSPTDGRSRTIMLTNSGGAALKAAGRLWRRAQAEFESANGGAVVRALRSTLANLKVGSGR
jgi:DNA-binding MarR family transcriptional regulator